MTFDEQARQFLANLETRKRRPAKPSTLSNYRLTIRRWLHPIIGQEELATFNNPSMRALAQMLIEKGAQSPTVHRAILLVKLVIASAILENGEPCFPRTWNAEFIDLPDLGPSKTPTITPEQLNVALASADAPLFALLAGSGLRIGEALALRWGGGEDTESSSSLDTHEPLVHVRTALWRGLEGRPKTPAGLRDVDLDPALWRYLMATLVPEEGKFVFDVWESTLREHLKLLQIPGFHCFRRWRLTHLRKAGCPELLIKFWMGHGKGADISNRYDMSVEDLEWRREWCERVGLKFQIPKLKEMTA